MAHAQDRPSRDGGVDDTFATATAVAAVAPGRYDATADARWTIGGKPNGGYLLALLARAVGEVSTHAHVVAASAHYLHSPDPGPVQLGVEVLRAGRTASQLRAWMRQGGRPCVEALFTTAVLDPAAEAHWQGADAVEPRPVVGSRADAFRVPGTNPAGVQVPIMDVVDLRVDRDAVGWARREPSGRGVLRGWLALPGDEPFDPVSLLYAVDAFPPATFDIELTGWVPTLELTAYVRALPAPGPLRIVQRAHLIDAQRVDEQCWAWDSRGRLVAQATQLAGIRLGGG